MTEKRYTPAYPAELRERGVRLFRDQRSEYTSDNAAYRAIAPKLGCSPDSLRVWCQQAERDACQRIGLTSAEKDRIKALERENQELRSGGARPPIPEMIAFIDDHCDVYGVGSICHVLRIAPSTYYAHKQIEACLDLASERVRSDHRHCADIRRVFEENRGLYGARKIWRALRRERKDIARCTVERLMKAMGLQGVVRSKKIITTNPDASQPCPQDKVNRQFRADRPNQLWLSDFTYVSTWQGMSYVAFVIDVFARKIVGWWVSTSMTTGFVLDALNQAICQRCPTKADGLTHHSDSKCIDANSARAA